MDDLDKHRLTEVEKKVERLDGRFTNYLEKALFEAKFAPVRAVVYGLVGFTLVGVGGFILTTVGLK